MLVLNAFAASFDLRRRNCAGCGPATAVTLPYVETFPHPWITIGRSTSISASSSTSFRSSCSSSSPASASSSTSTPSATCTTTGYARYFSYLNLFLFFMTILVLAGNVLLMFVGWEGVGLASYLLIGFYFQQDSAADAGKKAFIVNRIGDFGFLIGIFLLLANFGTLHLQPRFAAVSSLMATRPGTGGILTAICLCLLLGAAGKSAQLPLYIWLPDAMEGPTPVSALIHAATMVTAGVYMIARTHFLFDRSPFALATVAIVGAATALFAATIGLVQNDIKRVLAYSTISQLGYMFLACGVAAYSAAIFHLVTHAFFKALLFLAAGSVIHALGGEQDMRKMGGLRKKLPVTFWTMTAAVFAIAGFSPFAGFFSKDAILYAAFLQGTLGKVLWFVGLVTALLTSLYMFRLWYLTFFGESRTRRRPSAREPLVHARPARDSRRCSPSAAAGSASTASAPSSRPPSACTLAVCRQHPHLEAHPQHRRGCWSRSTAGSSPTSTTGARPERPAQLAAAMPAGYKLLANKYYVDEIYGAVIVKPLLRILAIRSGLGRRLRHSRRRRVAARRHRHLRRHDSAALAIRQSALLRGVAGCGRRSRCSFSAVSLRGILRQLRRISSCTAVGH